MRAITDVTERGCPALGVPVLSLVTGMSSVKFVPYERYLNRSCLIDIRFTLQQRRKQVDQSKHVWKNKHETENKAR
jgi:hypothetical protein